MHKDVLEKEDFQYVFEDAIDQAKNERRNMVSIDQSKVQEEDKVQGRQEVEDISQVRLAVLQQNEVQEILIQSILYGGQNRVKKVVQTRYQGRVSADKLQEILIDEGYIHE